MIKYLIAVENLLLLGMGANGNPRSLDLNANAVLGLIIFSEQVFHPLLALSGDDDEVTVGFTANVQAGKFIGNQTVNS